MKTLHIRDEEIQVVHLPVVFSALCEALEVGIFSINGARTDRCTCQVQVTGNTTRGSLPVVSDILRLLHALRDEIPLSSLLQLSADDPRSNARGPLELALNFYGLDVQLPYNNARKALQLPFLTVFEDIVSFSAICATATTTSVDHRKIFRDLLVQSLSLLNELVTAAVLERELTLIVDWNPSDWVSCLVAALETEVSVVLHTTSSLDTYHHLFRRTPRFLLLIRLRLRLSRCKTSLVYNRPHRSIIHL